MYRISLPHARAVVGWLNLPHRKGTQTFRSLFRAVDYVTHLTLHNVLVCKMFPNVVVIL